MFECFHLMGAGGGRPGGQPGVSSFSEAVGLVGLVEAPGPRLSS